MAKYHHGDLHRALIDAAVEVIGQEGAHALSLRKVARVAGVSHAAPAHHFKDLRGLLVEVAKRGYEGLLASMRKPTEGHQQLDRFRQVGVGYIEFAAQNPGLFRAMFHPELAKKPQPTDLHRRAAERTFDYLVSVIEACQHEGSVRAGDPMELATLAWSAVHGAAALLIDQQLPMSVEAAAATLPKHLFVGLASLSVRTQRETEGSLP